MEWKILEGDNITVQRKLNQWKHIYIIHIHGFGVNNIGDVSILLTREKKEN